MPVMFISGNEDFICPNQLLADCFDKISAPRKKNTIIPQATHNCFYDQPDIFLKAIVEFTESI